MALSKYDQVHLSKEDQDKISSLTNQAESGSISWDDAHAQAEAIRGNAGYSGGDAGDDYISRGGGTVIISGGGSSQPSGGGNSYEASDLSDYLKELYAQNTAAQLAALKSTYEQNAADLRANAEQIPETYQAARNETAAQNELERRAFQEYGIANGLNTGTSGQAELARSSVLQGNLAEISGREADALAENALEQERLAIAYRNAIDQAEASGNSALAEALYQEYVRQDQAAQDAATAAQEQANWQAQFDFAQQQYGDSLDSQGRDAAYNLAMTMLNAGIMPDSATLESAGISASDALAIREAVAQQQAGGGTSSSGSSGSGSSGGSGGYEPTLTYNQVMDAIDRGNLTPTVLADYRHYVGADYDAGGTGDTSDSNSNAPTTTTDHYYQAFLNSLTSQLNQGNENGIINLVDYQWNKLSARQKQGVQELLSQYGVAYSPD